MKKITKIMLGLVLCFCACTVFACKKEKKQEYVPIEITSVNFADEEIIYLYLNENNSYTFGFTMEPAEASYKDLTISMSNKGIIKFDNGTITGLKEGQTNLNFKAKKGEFDQTVTVNVYNPYAKTTSGDYILNLDSFKETLKSGQSIKLLRNIDATEDMFDISSTESIILDLNGKNINLGNNSIENEGSINFSNSAEQPSSVIANGIVLNNEGTAISNGINYVSNKSASAISLDDANFVIINNGSLTLNGDNITGVCGIKANADVEVNGATLSNTGYCLALSGEETDVTVNNNAQLTSDNNAVIIKNNANLILEAGEVKAKDTAILGDGETRMNMTLKNGTVESENSVGVLINSQGKSLIGATEENSAFSACGGLTIKGTSAVYIMLGEVVVGSPTLEATATPTTFASNALNSVVGDGSYIQIVTHKSTFATDNSLNFKYISTDTSTTAKVYSALNFEANALISNQEVSIENTNFLSVQYVVEPLKFVGQVDNIVKYTWNDGVLEIKPLTPVFFEGTISYEFNSNSNVRFEDMNGNAITPEDNEGTKDSIIEMDNSNGFKICLADGAVMSDVKDFEIWATFNGALVTIIINPTAQA